MSFRNFFEKIRILFLKIKAKVIKNTIETSKKEIVKAISYTLLIVSLLIKYKDKNNKIINMIASSILSKATEEKHEKTDIFNFFLSNMTE